MRPPEFYGEADAPLPVGLPLLLDRGGSYILGHKWAREKYVRNKKRRPESPLSFCFKRNESVVLFALAADFDLPRQQRRGVHARAERVDLVVWFDFGNLYAFSLTF